MEKRTQMNFVELENKIEKATKKAFIEMYEKHKDEEIYCFSIYSDEGAMTVCPSTNTLDFLDKLDEEEKEQLAYYKFEPAEWKYEMMGADEDFNEICKDLRNELENNEYLDNEEYNEKWFLKFQKALYQTCINILKKLKDENFFKKITGKDIFLIFSVSEYEFEKEEVEIMVSNLNNKGYRTEYLEWMKTWNE